MKRLAQTFLNTLSALIILAFIAYGLFWLYISQKMTKALDDIWSHQEKYLITISSQQPDVTGFPAPPEITFSGSITDRNGLVYASPEFTLKGFPVQTQAITLKAPQGLDLSGPVFKMSIHLDNFELRTRIPSDFPNRFDRATMANWQKQSGSLPIEKLDISRGSLKLEGEGYLNLDETLQPGGMIKVKLSGLDDLLHELVESGTIGDKQALMAQSLINLMSQKDETTGVSSLNTSLTIQGGGVFLGPMRVAQLPEWRWDN